MNTYKNLFHFARASAVLLALASCSAVSDSDQTNGVASAAEISSAETTGDSLSASQGYQKPGAAVRLVVEPVVGAQPGQTLDLRYQFQTSNSAGAATVQVSVDEGLSHTAASSYEFDLANDEFVLAFQANAAEAGVYYVRFMVEIDGQFRALGQRIQIGELAQTELQKSQGVVGGVISLPATETIKRN